MNKTIAAWTAAGLAEPGKVAPYLNIARAPDGQVAVTSRDADGVHVTLAIPADDWPAMKGLIFREPSALK